MKSVVGTTLCLCTLSRSSSATLHGSQSRTFGFLNSETPEAALRTNVSFRPVHRRSVCNFDC